MALKSGFSPHLQRGSCIRDPSISAVRPGRGAVREEGSHPPFFGDGVDGGLRQRDGSHADAGQVRGSLAASVWEKWSMPGESHTITRQARKPQIYRIQSTARMPPSRWLHRAQGHMPSSLLFPGKPSRRVGDDLTGQQKHHQHWLVTDLCVGGNMANQSVSPLVQQPQSGGELQGRGCASRLAGPQTRGSQRGEKTRPVSDRAIGHPLEQGDRAIMQSRRIGWAASQRGPQGSTSRPHLWKAARASGSPLHVPSLLLPRITRSWVHCVVGIAMQCPETFGRYRWLFCRPSRRVLGRRTGHVQGQP